MKTLSKNLFLYLNANRNTEICKEYNDIYCIGDMLVAIDKVSYNKNQRFKLQEKFNVYPYFVTQKVFKEILFSCLDIRVLNINFIDDSIADTEEYRDLEEIFYEEKGNAYNKIINIIEDFDTEIKSITFVYKLMRIELTNEGVLNFYSEEKLLNMFMADKRMNKILIGSY